MSQPLNDRILQAIMDEPGSSLARLCKMFDLTEYRLKRCFRSILRDLEGKTLVQEERRGVWVVELRPDKCQAAEWSDEPGEGYVQCARDPEFLDGRCYCHSYCENPEMTAFERRVSYLAGPREPSAYGLGQLTLSQVRDLITALKAISPMTLRDKLGKDRFLAMLRHAERFLLWKDMMRARERESEAWAPHDFAERLRASSGNTFEYSLKSSFVALEVTPKSSREEVLKAWRALSRRYHPDTPEGDEEKMKAINIAKDRIFRMRGWDREPSKK